MFGGFSAGDAAKEFKKMAMDERGSVWNDPEKEREKREVDREIKEYEREDKAIQYKTFEPGYCAAIRY